MATSDDDDDKDKPAEGENEDTDEAEASAEKGSASAEDEGAEEDESPAEKPASKPSKGTERALAAITQGAAKRDIPRPPPPSAGLGKSVTLFIGVVGAIVILMLLLGGERGTAGPTAPTWKEGDTVDVDITLVSTDRQDLACASGADLKGLHCGFESQGKRWTKSDPNDDKKTLRPYSTTNGINFLAAGVWTDPALSDKLPTTRFAVKCKLAVAGKFPRADVRWHEGEGWNGVSDWYTGTVSDCKLSSVQN